MEVHLAIIGVGLVGSEFLSQVLQLQLKVIATCSSKFMDLTLISDLKKPSQQPLDLNKFFQHCKQYTNVIIVDCTSTLDIPLLYSDILEWAHIITPNKKAFSSDFELYNSITQKSKSTNHFLFHESTVGAGLPIISTLQDLLKSKDDILKIEGVFSGTLSFIFNHLKTGKTFSEIVLDAKELGYTEPDPRDDLNGVDVARKVIILGRLCGCKLDLSTLEIENLVPDSLRSLPTNVFLEKVKECDGDMTRKIQDAKNSVLVYVGVLDLQNPENTKVGVQPYAPDHPFANLKGSDNVIKITTRRFPNGLVVQGAGAGAGVTAFGMVCDLFKVMRSLGL